MTNYDYLLKQSASPPPQTPQSNGRKPEPVAALEKEERATTPPEQASRQVRKRAENKTDNDAIDQASSLASYHASMIERIRKAVRSQEKEVSFIRLTEEEKNALADIVYTYKRQKTKTSENEINRIAINFLIADYQENG